MSHMKPKVTIQTIDGQKRLGTQWANKTFAVHRTYLRNGRTARCWTITHRPTGYAIIKHIDWRDAPIILKQLEDLAAKYDARWDGLCQCEDV